MLQIPTNTSHHRRSIICADVTGQRSDFGVQCVVSESAALNQKLFTKYLRYYHTLVSSSVIFKYNKYVTMGQSTVITVVYYRILSTTIVVASAVPAERTIYLSERSICSGCAVSIRFSSRSCLLFAGRGRVGLGTGTGVFWLAEPPLTLHRPLGTSFVSRRRRNEEPPLLGRERERLCVNPSPSSPRADLQPCTAVEPGLVGRRAVRPAGQQQTSRSQGRALSTVERSVRCGAPGDGRVEGPDRRSRLPGVMLAI